MSDSKNPVKSLGAARPNSKGVAKKRSEELSDYVFGKVPPQALALEEAVLGAVMLDKDAMSIVLDIVRGDSFYTEAHQLIFQAMLHLFEHSQPIDLLTVMEQLKKQGDLDTIGGPAYLASLTNKVASAANIEFHARIIAQKFIQRELIRVSTTIIRDAFEDTTDVFDLLDNAEQGLFSIAEKNMSRGYEAMSSLASKVYKQLQEVKDKEDGLTGIPSGFTELDRLTSGWQPSDLVIIAARPGMGKTAFVLSAARNTAVEFRKGVAIFSLEMSSIQLALRMIAMEAEVSSSKLRNGQFDQEESTRLNAAIERIGEAPIFIDDTAGINIFELRAKCRRMKMQHDIQLVIIDYLQLMSGGGDNQRGNREQEVSAISRALKALAKELNVPVIALSQLSRAVEVRGGSKRPQLSDLRESGCLTGDTLIQDAVSGKKIAIKELAEQTPLTDFEVLAVNACQQIRPYPLAKAFYSGQKQVFELKTRTGRRIKASANHPFLKLEGWTALENLAVGNRIGVPRKLEIAQPSNPMTNDELILLAHLIGDGCILPKQPYHYTSADEQNIEIVNSAAKNLFGIQARIVEQENWWHTYLPSPQRLTHGKQHPITIWYEQLGLERVRSYAKRLPQVIFQCDETKICLFLHHLWATDGNINWKKSENRKAAGTIYYASSSQMLAEQIQNLLLRLGIISTIVISQQQGGKYRDNFHVQIQGAQNQLSFLELIGCFGKRGEIVPDLIATLKSINTNPNNDVLPKEAWDLLVYPAMQRQGLSYRKLFDKLEQSYAGSIKRNGISKDRIRKLYTAIGDEQLKVYLDSQIYWDEILSITPLGVEDVYDLTVPEVHNFVANDILVHNSIEQDADIVSFIYRPEYYGITEDPEGQSLKGVAEIIVAKHRNGALKDVRLRFTDQFARFSDLDDTNFGDFAFDPAADNSAVSSGIITRPSKMNEDEDIPF
jgi:replicative DNA helicase